MNLIIYLQHCQPITAPPAPTGVFIGRTATLASGEIVAEVRWSEPANNAISMRYVDISIDSGATWTTITSDKCCSVLLHDLILESTVTARVSVENEIAVSDYSSSASKTVIGTLNAFQK